MLVGSYPEFILRLPGMHWNCSMERNSLSLDLPAFFHVYHVRRVDNNNTLAGEHLSSKGSTSGSCFVNQVHQMIVLRPLVMSISGLPDLAATILCDAFNTLRTEPKDSKHP